MSEPGTKRRSPWFSVSGLFLLAALLAAVFVQVRQYALLNQAVQEQDDFTVLSLYQLEVEYLRLRKQLADAERLLGTDAAFAAELQLRYDIFLSRVDLLKTVRARRLVTNAARSQATIQALETFVARADVYLGVEPRGALSRSAAGALSMDLERLGDPIHQLLLDATQRVAAQITDRRDQVRRHNSAGLLITVFLSAMVLVFGGIALRQMRLLERRRLSLEVLAAQLRDARTAAESANAGKSAFLADMSHELRTPLHGLRGMLDLASKAPRDLRAPDWLIAADDSAAHLQRLLDDVLDLSKLESGALDLDPQAVDLHALVRETCDLMRPQADLKRLHLDASVDADLSRFVRLDPTRVRQVLFNLLHNAIKYSDAGTIVLRCRPVAAADGTALLEFIVVDSGIGMDADALQRLFQRYSRIDHPVALLQRGAGLGLAISRNLARLMGGDLDARSTPGLGSVFSFRCAMQAAAAPDPKPAAAAATGARSLRVLVAEDHPINRLYLVALLQRLGHQAHAVEHGQQALQAMREQQPFDIILMDVHMPVMDGAAAATAIRALPASVRQPRIVALTADVFADTHQRCTDAGMDEVMTKPVNAESLDDLLQRQCGVAGPSRKPTDTALAAAARPTPRPSLSPALQLLDPAAQADVREAMGSQRARVMYAGLFEQAVESAARMRAALREADIDALRRMAHAIKGASANLGLPALADAASILSTEAHAMAAPQLALAVQRFEEMVRATRSLCETEGLIGD